MWQGPLGRLSDWGIDPPGQRVSAEDPRLRRKCSPSPLDPSGLPQMMGTRSHELGAEQRRRGSKDEQDGRAQHLESLMGGHEEAAQCINSRDGGLDDRVGPDSRFFTESPESGEPP